MGLAATQMRFLALTARKSNTEYQGQQINQQRLNLANQSSGIYSELAALDVPIPPDPSAYATEADYNAAYTTYEGAVVTYNTTMRTLEATAAGVQQKDKKLEMQLKMIDTEHSALKTEIDAIKKIIDDNIEASFKTFG